MHPPTRIFIIPYRNREAEKKKFLQNLQYLISDDTEFYFSHQQDKRIFNRGAMKNIGFLAMKKKYPKHYRDITFVFHDIDNWPKTRDLIDYETNHGNVAHYYGFNNLLGGMFAIKGSDFEETNGFPNFWGWGLEDNVMNNRCIAAGLHIDRTCFYNINDDRIFHSTRGNKRIVSKNHSSHYADTIDGLDTLKYVDYNIDDMIINVTKFEGLYRLDDQDFYSKDLRNEPDKLYIYKGYTRKSWNMRHLMN